MSRFYRALVAERSSLFLLSSNPVFAKRKKQRGRIIVRRVFFVGARLWRNERCSSCRRKKQEHTRYYYHREITATGMYTASLPPFGDFCRLCQSRYRQNTRIPPTAETLPPHLRYTTSANFDSAEKRSSVYRRMTVPPTNYCHSTFLPTTYGQTSTLPPTAE